MAVNPLKETTELAKKLATRGIDIPTEIDWNGLLDLALSSIVLPALDPSVITFIFDFPADPAQLSRIKYDSGEQIAARFEVFFQGLEIGNGFGELTDPVEQKNRFKSKFNHTYKTSFKSKFKTNLKSKLKKQA